MSQGGPDVFYDYQVVGEFTDNGLAAQINNPLNWLPENTYTVPPVVTRYDARGNPVKPTTLIPTTNPAGFIVQPPLALTTIAAARELVGDHFISAIRCARRGCRDSQSGELEAYSTGGRKRFTSKPACKWW